MEKVFGIGFSKTGTTSLEYALEKLGYKVYHGHYNLKHNDYMLALWIHRDYEEIRKMSQYWDAFADAPWGGTDLYKRLYEWYPDAKFIHTMRNSEAWYNSLEKMLTRFDSNLETALETFHENGRYGFTYFTKQTFGIDTFLNNKQKIIDHYNRHNNEIIEFMTKHNANYLRFNDVKEQAWNVLCPFLVKEIPEVSYPHLNAFEPINNPKAESAVNIKTRIISKLKKLIKL